MTTTSFFSLWRRWLGRGHEYEGCSIWLAESPFRCDECGKPMQTHTALQYWARCFQHLWRAVLDAAFTKAMYDDELYQPKPQWWHRLNEAT